MKAFERLVAVVFILGFLLLGMLSLTEHYYPPITNSELERIFTIPPLDEPRHNERFPTPVDDTTG